jgi:MFS family permease
MSQVVTPAASPMARFNWQTPIVILICACAIGTIGYGARTGLGFFLKPMSAEYGWGRDVLSLALGIQMLLWGVAQPFMGALADRYGPVLVMASGAVLYAIGLVGMSYSSTPGMLYFTSGIVMGLGLAASSFTLVIGVLGKLMPPEWRTLSFGLGTAAGSFGQFLFSPLSVALIGAVGWHQTLTIYAVIVLAIIPLAVALSMSKKGLAGTSAASEQSAGQAMSEALGHKSYILLVLGFFTCGFQIFFVSVHLPAYLVDRGLPAEIGGWALGTIGLFNIIGAISAGYFAAKLPKRYILSAIYFGRAIAILIYIMLPPSTVTTLIFGAVLGLLWLSTVPPTSGLVAVMFGTRWLATLFGFAFFSHQVGGFLGVWLGGILFEKTGSYDIVWWLSIALGVVSAVINLPIVEKPIARLSPQPA